HLYQGLRRSEEQFHTVFRASPIAIVIVSFETQRVLDANESYFRLTGYPRAEAIGRTNLELGVWVDPSVRARMIEELRRTGSARDIAAQLRRKSGELREVVGEAELTQIAGERCILAMVHDMTDLRRLEAEL